MKFQLTQISLLLSSVFLATGAYAQSTTNVGTVQVQGSPGGTDTGLIQQEDTPKARSSVNRDFIDKQGATANPYQLINLLPGVTSFGHDATGLFGGGIRVRGFNSDQLGFTINGVPVNDSGNFAVFPQEYTDQENLCSIFVTQGSADTDAPHVGASGGNIGIQSCQPKDTLGGLFTSTFGSDSLRRNFLRLDSGKLFDGLFKFYVSDSHAEADKFRGQGGAKRDHQDFGARLDLGKGSYIDASYLYNRAVNNNYRTLTKQDIQREGYYADFNTIGPVHQPAVAGVAQNDSTFAPNVANGIFAAPAGPNAATRTADGYYGFNLNPFRNTIATVQGHWQVAPTLSVDVSPYFWYGYGTGGNELFTFREGNAGNLLHGGVKDSNGDGDVLDTIAGYDGSLTKTYRPGVTSKITWQLYNNRITLGYWYEKARHQQTGPYLAIDNAGNTADIWERNSDQYIRQQDGQPLYFRDWYTVNTAKEPILIDTITLFDDKLAITPGVKHTFLERNFTNSANTGTGAGADYRITRNYSKTLPSFGVTFHFTPEQSVYANASKNFRAPSNTALSGLVVGGTIVNGVTQGFRIRDPNVIPETSWNTEVGYRFAGERWTFSSALYYINYRNRISTAFDFTQNLSIDTNVGSAKLKGVEIESAYKITNQVSVYGSATYNQSRMSQDFQSSAAIALPTTGKQFPGAPKWLGALNLQYASGPYYAFIQSKYTGREFTTLVNDDSVPGYALVNLGAGYTLPSMYFLKDPVIRANVFNVTNKKYLSVSSGSGNSFRQNAFPVVTPGGTKASDSAVQFYEGSPITFAISLGTSF